MSLLELGVDECDNLIFFLHFLLLWHDAACLCWKFRKTPVNQPTWCMQSMHSWVCVCVCVSDIKNRLMRTSRVPATAWVSRRRWSVPASLRTTYPAIKPTLTSTATLRIRFDICFGCEYRKCWKCRWCKFFPHHFEIVGLSDGKGNRCVTSCAGGRHNMPPPLQVDPWPYDLESGIRVTCDVGYLCANF